MLSPIVVFILGVRLGYFATPSLSYECKPPPALEFTFASRPKCFNTCPHLSTCANSRAGEDGRKPWTSTACHCISSSIWATPSGFFLQNIDCATTHYEAGINTCMGQEPCLSLFPGLGFTEWAWMQPLNQSISGCIMFWQDIWPQGDHTEDEVV